MKPKLTVRMNERKKIKLIHILYSFQVWIKLNVTLWPKTQEDKEQVFWR